jgi:uncharacterized protein YjiS (DUF1127 family)
MHVATHRSLTDCQGYSRRQTSGSIAVWVTRLIGRWRTRVQERKAFAKMNHRDLHDIGVSRWEIERELAKPFWRA